MDTKSHPESDRRPLVRRTFCIPVDTVQRVQDAAIANGWRLGHIVEQALESYLGQIGGPFPPTTTRLPVGRPKQRRASAEQMPP
jgi:hypothetical protein